ncbi:hypothetical protein [Mariniflexile sp. HMF6888]|uniref:hypothetical protein n=1 Tax=Mariniflexile sp. HMF6888 TaxID=3373086 RepID=UPI00378E6425
MKQRKLELIDEQKSPLFRIMSVTNADEPARRKFDNNISAFHIGNGYVLSVAHNLRSLAQLFKSIPEADYQGNIVPHLNANEIALFNRCYILDNVANNRHLSSANQQDITSLIGALNRINYDTRWINFYQNNICKPFLIIQFRNNQLYNDAGLTALIGANRYFPEPAQNRHTFILELELVNAYYSEDIALYKITNTHKDIIDEIPSVQIDYEIYDTSNNNFFCLQSAPVDNLGRLLNEAKIEGILDHWNIFSDRFQGNYIVEGLRYLIKGYFRFGSSGAPYFMYDEENDIFKVNAVQSEASPIQLSINNNRNGNFQYINAIASPLSLIRDRLEQEIN